LEFDYYNHNRASELVRVSSEQNFPGSRRETGYEPHISGDKTFRIQWKLYKKYAPLLSSTFVIIKYQSHQ